MNLEGKWASLAKQAQQGDKNAYHQLLTEVNRYAVSIIRKKVGFYIADTDDIAQECLMGIHRSLSTYHPSRQFKPWVTAIIHHKLADYFRKNIKIRETEVHEDAELVTSSPLLTNYSNETEDIDNSVGTSVEQLPRPLKQAILLTKVDGLSYAEAAKQENITEATLRKRISRAYKQILESLSQETG
ncbi:MAG: RNA polymerase sigma factor [Gammaproteobacteria bacterium]